MDRTVCIDKGMSKRDGSARERLLRAASELFYAEGIHTVGIDRVIERAGVAKASLYSAFGSKDELVRAYLEARAASRHRRISERIARHERPRDRILAIFDDLGEISNDPAYRGCAFINASAEGPRGEPQVASPSAATRGWLRSRFAELAGELGASGPAQLADQLVLLYDGAIIGTAMDGDLGAPARARVLASLLLDAWVPATTPRRRRPRRRTDAK